MAKSEILMWVAGIMMMIILGLAVAPTISKSGDTAKIAVINSELNSIRNASIIYLAKSPTGTFTGITATEVQSYLPGLNLASTKLQSKVNPLVTYLVAPNGINPEQLTITVEGLDKISTAETTVKTSQTPIAVTITDTNTTDGTLVFDFRG